MRILMELQFCGTPFSGWQLQVPQDKLGEHPPTIQSCVEQALVRYEGSVRDRIPVIGAGRTDTGVHARRFTCHFDLREDYHIRMQDLKQLVKALNAHLPADIRALEARIVPVDFHAQKSLRSKTYRYQLYFREFANPLIAPYVWHQSYAMDSRFNFELFRSLVQSLHGTHDFVHFAAAQRTALTTRRQIFHASVTRQEQDGGDLVVVEFCANGFLRQMIRNLVGTMVDMSRGSVDSSRWEGLLAADPKMHRGMGGRCAPPQGLILWDLVYN